MKRGMVQGRFFPAEAFDMTPIIDVVFLLIIFFMLVCQFIVAENFQVEVPGQIETARPAGPDSGLMTTVTVMENIEGDVQYAVGSDILAAADPEQIPVLVSAAIDQQLQLLSPDRRIVRLRCEKTLPFGVVKYALEGISRSRAADIQWAVLKGE